MFGLKFIDLNLIHKYNSILINYNCFGFLNFFFFAKQFYIDEDNLPLSLGLLIKSNGF